MKFDLFTMSDLSELKFELHYNEDTPLNELKKNLELFGRLQKIVKINFEEIQSLATEEINRLENEIRIAATRWKFRVVSGGGAALALSGASKSLNYQHGPILIIRKDENVIRVFPSGEQGIRGSRIKSTDFLKQLLKGLKSDDAKIDYYSFGEEDLRNLIIQYPRLIEDGLTFVDTEVDIESARIDLVLKDSNDNHLLLEFKLTAKDSTIGQVTRYNIDTYSKKFEIPKEKIRKGIISLTYSGQLADACKENSIELYLLTTKNKGYKFM